MWWNVWVQKWNQVKNNPWTFNEIHTHTLTHSYIHTVTSIQYANDFKLRLNLKTTTTTKKSTENTNVTEKSEWKSDKLNALINIEWKKAVKMFYFHYFVFVFTSKNMYEAAIQRKKETELRKKNRIAKMKSTNTSK